MRVAALVLAMFVHLGLFGLLSGEPSPWASADGMAVARAVLRVRFVERAPPPPDLPVPARRMPAPSAMAPERVVERTPARRAVQRSSAQAVRSAPAAPKSAAPDYVAGGAGFGAGLDAARTRVPVVRLPGTGEHLVDGLALVDPRSQGVGGAVRMLAGLFGATDPHCVAVDSWRSLSTQEMLDRHISPDEVDRVSEAYHCRPR